jgi:hypothetical protein
MVVYNYNPSTWKTEARGLNIRGQPGLHRGYTARPCLKKRRRKEEEEEGNEPWRSTCQEESPGPGESNPGTFK